MRYINQLPISLKEVQIEPVGPGTYPIPDDAIGCIVEARPRTDGNGTGTCVLKITGVENFERRWERSKYGRTGHGHTFGITTQVFFSGNDDGSYGDELVMSISGIGHFLLMAWIVESSTPVSSMKHLPTRHLYSRADKNLVNPIEIPKSAVAVHVEVRHNDGSELWAHLDFNNDCRRFRWFKSKTGGTGYRYDPTYSDVIWLLESESGKYPTELNVSTNSGYINILGWMLADMPAPPEITRNVLHAGTYYSSDMEADSLGYSRVKGEEAGSLNPIRISCKSNNNEYWFEPLYIAQYDIPETIVQPEDVSMAFMEYDHNLPETGLENLHILWYRTSRTAGIFMIVICEGRGAVYISGISLSDMEYISNPLNLTDGEDTEIDFFFLVLAGSGRNILTRISREIGVKLEKSARARGSSISEYSPADILRSAEYKEVISKYITNEGRDEIRRLICYPFT